MDRLGIVGLHGLRTTRAKKLKPGDVLIRPGSSIMCWEVMRLPVEAGRSVKLIRCMEFKNGERGTNHRSFTFRRNERLAVMERVDRPLGM